MEDETATVAVDETPAPQGQAEATTTDTAENETTEVTTDQETQAETTSDGDDDLAWAKKKGLDVHDDPKLAKMLRNADRKVSEAGLKAKTTLQAAVDKTAASSPDDDVVTELQTKYRVLETKFAAQQYYLDNPDDKQYDAEASTILSETLVEDPEFARALGRNLPKLFALAKARHSEEALAKAEEKGRKDERRNLAGKQRASATSQAATTSAPPAEEDPFMKGFNNPW